MAVPRADKSVQLAYQQVFNGSAHSELVLSDILKFCQNNVAAIAPEVYMRIMRQRERATEKENKVEEEE